MSEVDYSAYWKRHPDLLKRVELVALYGHHYDHAAERQDWRVLLALARWARVWNMPGLERKAKCQAMKLIPKNEREILEVMECKRA